MAIQYTFKPEKDVLVVETTGFDENVKEVMLYGKSVVDECRNGNFKRLLCNELQLEYRLGIFDTFALAKYISQFAAEIGRAAIVCNEKYFVDTKFWETAAVNRGLEVRVFKDMETARQWVEES